MWNAVWPYLAAIIPTLVVAFLFYLIMKAILESDRRERAAVKKWEDEQDQLRADPVRSVPGPATPQAPGKGAATPSGNAGDTDDLPAPGSSGSNGNQTGPKPA